MDSRSSPYLGMKVRDPVFVLRRMADLRDQVARMTRGEPASLDAATELVDHLGGVDELVRDGVITPELAARISHLDTPSVHQLVAAIARLVEDEPES
jgi:hypothetical protein